MKTLIKGMILFFFLLLAGLIGLLSWALIKDTDGMPVTGSSNWSTTKILVSTQTCELEEISEILVKNYSSDIFFYPGDGETLVIKEYVTSRRNQHSFVTVSSTGGRIKIETDRDHGDSWIVFGNNYRCMEIYLPEFYQDAIDIQTSSGDIYSDMDLTFTSCTMSSSSGDINLATLTGEMVLLETSSGDIFASTVSGEQSIGTQSGTIRIINARGDADITTSSGDIKIEALEGAMSAQTASGDIWVGSLTGSAMTRSSSGDVKLQVASLLGSLDLETSSGTVLCELPEETHFQFEAATSSGDIRTYFDDALGFNRKGTQAQGSVGSGSDFLISVHTSSGDVKFISR